MYGPGESRKRLPLIVPRKDYALLSTDDFSPGFTEFLTQAGRLPVLSARQEVMLAKAREAGDVEAGRKLVEHNIRLAVSVAKRYRNKGVPLEDLVQEGVIGLHRAVSKWEWQRGLKFSTYAVWWIEHFVRRSVQNMATTIRTPNHVTVARGRIFNALRDNPDLTTEELAVIAKCKPEEVHLLMDVARVVVSLDPPEAGGDTSLYERIESVLVHHGEDWSDVIEHKRVRDAMVDLSPLERSVLELRFGFEGYVHSRDEVAEKMGIAASVVVKSQRSGLQKLRRVLGAIQPAPPVVAVVVSAPPAAILEAA